MEAMAAEGKDQVGEKTKTEIEWNCDLEESQRMRRTNDVILQMNYIQCIVLIFYEEIL